MKWPTITPVNFRTNNITVADIQHPSIENQKHTDIITCRSFKENTHEPWDLSEIETFFANCNLPSHPIRINPWTLIVDPALFVSSHLKIIKYNNGICSFRPYFNRLNDFFLTLQKTEATVRNT